TKAIPAAESFRLYDTYGFPIDLLEDICREEGFQLDKAGFHEEMENQKKKARAASRFAQEDPGVQKAYKTVLEQTGKTRFLGYEKTEADSQLLAILKGTERIKKASAGEEVLGVFRETPFYGEGGGQVGDRGWVTAEPDLRAEVIHTFKPLPDFFIHKMIIREGEIRETQSLHLQVDPDLRAATARNHTATHLLHAVLREVLGDHVKQAGSYVGPDRLRFDFNHFVSLDSRELEKIETIVNERILMNVGVNPEEKGIEDALKGGALAFFGDKYGDTVRVVNIPGLSQELCGGTHCRATGDIGSFKITSESSVAAGVRRIEALTGMGSYRHRRETESRLAQMAGSLKSREEDAPQKLQKLLDSIKEKEKEISLLKMKVTSGGSRDTKDEIKKIGDAAVLIKKMDGLNPKELREALDQFRNRPEIDIVVLGSSLEDKVFLTVGIRGEKTGQFHAGEIVKAISLIVEGTGGGKPDMAQGGGKNPARLEEALQMAETIIRRNSSPGSAS
ncbi:MAG TPA: alanine--tRNA ligase-related protein, partial [Nitrospiria bacterium]|nr:alanine--tRNA ligase-related protein [Nitrospiria bacterium]